MSIGPSVFRQSLQALVDGSYSCELERVSVLILVINNDKRMTISRRERSAKLLELNLRTRIGNDYVIVYKR